VTILQISKAHVHPRICFWRLPRSNWRREPSFSFGGGHILAGPAQFLCWLTQDHPTKLPMD